MENNNQEKKDGIVLRYSVLLAVVWFAATYWMHLEMLESLFSGWNTLLAGAVVSYQPVCQKI